MRKSSVLLLFGALLALAPAAHAASIGFSHAAVVDQQRPGFEPDVKVGPNGHIFTSVPFGFSTTESFLWSSRDHGNSYQLTPGNLGPGKPTTCFGGGDTDLFIDPGNALYFSDLQGLTNISNSFSTDEGATWSTNCVGSPNTPDDRMWFTGTGSMSAGNLNLYQDYDVVASPSGGNQLVETISHDGMTFAPVVNANPGLDCAGTAPHDCVTGNEGISGNQVVDPATGNVYIAHTTTNGTSGTPGVQVSEGKITPGTPTTATWSESPNLDAALCPNPSCVDSNGNPEEIAGENFASIAQDSAGFLYVTFTAGPIDHANQNDPNFGALTAPEQIYVVRSLQPAGAGTHTWSAPQRITSAGTNTFPWITAGSGGRVDVAWYHTDETSEQGTCPNSSGTCTNYGAGSFQNAEWSVQLGQSLNADSGNPSYGIANVSEGYVKHGQICTNGLTCATGGDRSLGDFLQVTTDAQGAAVVSYVFDTSADSSAGEDVGPEVISRQISGPSLFAGNVSQASGPGVPMGSVSDPTGDAFYSANSTRTAAGDNLDLTGASLANNDGTLDATIKVKSLASLTPAGSAGGPDASWLIRWTDVRPGTTGNGHIYYAGMDNNQGAGGSGQPTFFAGDTAGIPPANSAEHTKYMAFPQSHAVSGSYNSASGTITIHIPWSDVGSPAYGTPLYSVTAFTATSTSPQSSSTLFNLIDAATPFDLVVGPAGFVGTTPTLSGGGANASRAACPAATGKLTGRGLGRLSIGMTRSRARHLLRKWSTRGHRYMDFFCLSPIGVRDAYINPTLDRMLPARQRKGQQGRIVWLLTSNPHYALRGVRPGTRLTRKVRRRLRISRPYRVGLNTWYLTADGNNPGLIKVRRGYIEEIGLTDARFAHGSRATLRLLRAFR